MQRILSLLAIGVCANVLVSLAASAQTKPEVTLTRLDCGTNQAPTEVNLRFSDTYAYGDLKLQIVYSCLVPLLGQEEALRQAEIAERELAAT